jgi:tol-pal system protein YbgF
MIRPMRLRRLLPAATIAVLLLAGGAASGQTPMDDPLSARDAKRLDKMEQVLRELRSIVFQGRDIGKPVVVQPAETQYVLERLIRRTDDLEQSLRRLNGQLEALTNDLNQARQATAAADAQNKALSDRIATLERQLAPAPEPNAAAGPAPDAGAPPAAGGANDAFAQARQLMLNGDYDNAERAWQDYVNRYAETAKAPEARYWLGKTLGVRGAHNDAAAAYIGAIRGWPQTNWAPDAVVELSRELLALKRNLDACQMLGELDRRYPKAMPAAKSRAQATRTQAKCA